MNLRKSLIVLLSLLVWTLPETHATGKKILYIGDSVTDGNWGKVSGGPNRSLTDMNHIFGHGYMFICAARYMADYPEEDYRFYNRGISGNRVADLKARWQQDALEIDPDILSVLVGVNDLLDVYNKTDGPQEVDTARFEADYRDILDRSRAQNPEVRIVLAEPFILPVGMWQEHYTHWRAVRPPGRRRKKAGQRIRRRIPALSGIIRQTRTRRPDPEVIVLDVGRYAPHGGRSRKDGRTMDAESRKQTVTTSSLRFSTWEQSFPDKICGAGGKIKRRVPVKNRILGNPFHPYGWIVQTETKHRTLPISRISDKLI